MALRYIGFRHAAPVAGRWLLTCAAAALGLGAVGLGHALLRKSLLPQWHGRHEPVPLPPVLMLIVVVAPVWYLSTHCACDPSTLGPTGACPACGRGYDDEERAALWAKLGFERPSEQS